jgi:hypothetical protein
MSPAELNILKSFGQVAAPAGLAIGVFFFLLRALIPRLLFPSFTKAHSYRIVIILVFAAWSVALAGVLAYVYVSSHQSREQGPTDVTVNQSPEKSDRRACLSGDAGACSRYADLRMQGCGNSDLPCRKTANCWEDLSRALVLQRLECQKSPALPECQAPHRAVSATDTCDNES